MHRRRFLQVLCLSAVILTAFLVMPKSVNAAVGNIGGFYIENDYIFWDIAKLKEMNLLKDPTYESPPIDSYTWGGLDDIYMSDQDGNFPSYFGFDKMGDLGDLQLYFDDYKNFFSTTHPNYAVMGDSFPQSAKSLFVRNANSTTAKTFQLNLANGVVQSETAGSITMDYSYDIPINSMNPLVFTFTMSRTSNTQDKVLVKIDAYDDLGNLLQKGIVPTNTLYAIPDNIDYYDSKLYANATNIKGCSFCGYIHWAKYIENVGTSFGQIPDGSGTHGSFNEVSGMIGFLPDKIPFGTKNVRISIAMNIAPTQTVSLRDFGLFNNAPSEQLMSDGTTKMMIGPNMNLDNLGEDKKIVDHEGVDITDTTNDKVFDTGNELADLLLNGLVDLLKWFVDWLFIPPEEFIETQIEGMVWSVETALGINGLMEQVEGYANANPTPPDFPSFEFNGMRLDFNEIINLEIYDDNRELFIGFLKGVIYFFILLATLNNVGKLFGFQLFNSVGILTGATKTEEKNNKEAKK